MSIFGSIMNKIFHHDAAGSPSGAAATQGGAAASNPQVASATAAAPSGSTAGAGASPAETVDVAAVLNKMAAGAGQKLDWQKSIVDLMKLLNMDSSLEARKELAQELHYTGDTNDSAKMNIWLHKQVMRKLAETGGKVPESMTS